MPRIEICGGIASGKTTIAALLERAGFLTRYEDFKANPFWKLFYTDPDFFAFETEITFSLQHYSEIKSASASPDDLLVCDFATTLDQAYAHVSLDGRQLDIFFTVHDQILREIGQADLLVYLQCGADELLRRIRNRNRPEEAAIRVEFLEEMNASLSERVQEFSAAGHKIISIDSEARNFADQAATGLEVIEEILAALP